MCPLTTDIYARIVNYFFHLLELAGKGNTVIRRDKFKARNKATAHV